LQRQPFILWHGRLANGQDRKLLPALANEETTGLVHDVSGTVDLRLVVLAVRLRGRTPNEEAAVAPGVDADLDADNEILVVAVFGGQMTEARPSTDEDTVEDL